MSKLYLPQDVYDAALERLNFIFDEFPAVCVSFSGGKDSTVLLHLAQRIAQERNRQLHVLFIDLEGQYRTTIAHIEEMLALPGLIPYWVCLPLNLRNAVSVFNPHWCCWEPGKEDQWVRDMPTHPAVISDPAYFPFYRYRMEFEEFTPAFAHWLAAGKPLASLVGIRADESLNRYRTIVRQRESRYQGRGWSTRIGDEETRSANACVYNFYPIYDWRVEDIWGCIGKERLAYNRLYDYMYLAGKSPHEMRICQPYGDDQRKGLDQFHQIEPETWFRIVQRVSGANYGAKYAGQKMLGYRRGLGLPSGHTWESYTRLLLDNLPAATGEHYRKKFAVFIDWWQTHGGWEGPIPDTADADLEAHKRAPSWRRMAMCILKNDFWCKSLSFGMTKDVWATHYQPVAETGQTLVKKSVKDIYKDL